jgi:hypothetical protein
MDRRIPFSFVIAGALRFASEHGYNKKMSRNIVEGEVSRAVHLWRYQTSYPVDSSMNR